MGRRAHEWGSLPEGPIGICLPGIMAIWPLSEKKLNVNDTQGTGTPSGEPATAEPFPSEAPLPYARPCPRHSISTRHLMAQRNGIPGQTVLAGRGTRLKTTEMSKGDRSKEFGCRVSTPVVIIRQLLPSRAGAWWGASESDGFYGALGCCSLRGSIPQGHRQDQYTVHF